MISHTICNCMLASNPMVDRYYLATYLTEEKRNLLSCITCRITGVFDIHQQNHNKREKKDLWAGSKVKFFSYKSYAKKK